MSTNKLRFRVVSPADRRDWEIYVPMIVYGVNQLVVLEYWNGDFWETVELSYE